MQTQIRKSTQFIMFCGFFIISFTLFFSLPQQTHAFVSNGMRMHLESGTEAVALGSPVFGSLVVDADTNLDSLRITFSSSDNITINGEIIDKNFIIYQL